MDVVAAQQARSSVAVGGSGGVVVETQTTVAASASASNEVTKVVVAVHGVGDQHQYATIQSVVGQFCRYYHAPPATPLGSFHNQRQTYAFKPPVPAPQLEQLAFAEVYWATIPRKAVTEQHTLEEAKKWAGTIVERLRLRWHQDQKDHPQTDCKDGDFKLLKQILTEMIQTVAVLERLCYLADRAGLFTFDLRKLLDDYLGDVQVVAEFGDSRGEILDAFFKVMDKANKEYPNAELYIVAHSEGTVVAFLGLLQALRSPIALEWATKVRGLMTIGSPIDKHLMLWPELFEGNDPNWYPAPNQKIEWRNYYDRGDPIGFDLENCRRWIDQRSWARVFNFELAHDIGFIRYPFPGKAHVDYWEDEAVFGHFIKTVVKPDANVGVVGEKSPDAEGEEGLPPGDKQIYKWSSYILPYIGIWLLLFLAVYFPFKAIAGYVEVDRVYGASAIARDVAGVAVFLLGITLAARIPRLTRARSWRLLAWVVYVLSAALGWWLVGVQVDGETADFNVDRWSASVLGVLSFALVVVSRTLNAARPSWGLKPLIVLGTTMFLGVAAYLLRGVSVKEEAKLWPVFLALGGFTYLWWLAALVFDLIFVWHVHVRQSVAMKRLRSILPSRGPDDRAVSTRSNLVGWP
jgi:hypothetical protein